MGDDPAVGRIEQRQAGGMPAPDSRRPPGTAATVPAPLQSRFRSCFYSSTIQLAARWGSRGASRLAAERDETEVGDKKGLGAGGVLKGLPPRGTSVADTCPAFSAAV